MDTPAVCDVGDRVQVLVGRRWHRATVTAVWRLTRYRGHSTPAYAVRLAGGGNEIMCGDNTIRHVMEERPAC